MDPAQNPDKDANPGPAGKDPAPPDNGPDNSPKSGGPSKPGFETLLKNPAEIIRFLKDGPDHRVPLHLAAVALVCLLGFGFVVGTMSGGTQLWAAPLKVAGGVLASALICLPSLYIFTCLTGIEIRPGSLAGLLAACICLSALLLVGFAPVAWLFAQSTDSTLFFGTLCLSFWAVALFFGINLIRQAASLFAAARRYHLLIWAGIFSLVTLQMATSIRPIIGTAPSLLPTEKKFFLEHWFDEVKDAGKSFRERRFSEVEVSANAGEYEPGGHD